VATNHVAHLEAGWTTSPIPDKQCDSVPVAIDFIGPLPPDEGFNGNATFTDTSGSDIRIIPTTTNFTAKRLAQLFFKE
jgi:hypothetical protein